MDYSLLADSFNDKPSTLYHYTSLEALTSIVQSKRVRASTIRFLNDSSESQWLKHQVITALRKRSRSPNQEDVIARIIAAIETRPRQSLFVASFTENADDLSQWRAYCPRGLGVSIGFSTDCLDQQWVANPREGDPFFSSASLQKVRYHSSEHDADLENVLDTLLKGDVNEIEQDMSGVLRFSPQAMMVMTVFVLKLLEGTVPESNAAVGARSLPVWLDLVSPFFKHYAFSGEAEWRKVVSKDHRLMPGQQFRQGISTLIPYVEIMLDVMTDGPNRVAQKTYFINEVVIGPTPNPDLTLEALEALFASEGHPEVKVKLSDIPYRSW